MTDARDRIREATPLPWFDVPLGRDTRLHGIYREPEGVERVGVQFELDRAFEPADADLIVYAVNRLPDYLAAVDAATALVEWINGGGDVRMYPNASRLLDLRAALRRLRDEVPA